MEKKKPLLKSMLPIVLALSLSIGMVAVDLLKKDGGDELNDTSKEIEDETNLDCHGVSVKHISTTKGARDVVTRTFTYQIAPENASQKVSLSLAWKDYSGTESVDDYMAYTLDQDNHMVTLTSKKAFGNVIEAKIISAIDPSIFAAIELHFVQRFTGFKEDGFGNIMLSESLTSLETLTAESTFLGNMTDVKTARFHPTFSDVYTKPYPSGHEVTYTIQFNRYEPYVKSEFVSSPGLKTNFQAAMNKVGNESGGNIWAEQSTAKPLEGLDKVYQKLSYADQRLLNKEATIGICRVYKCLIHLDESNKMDYEVRWLLKANTSDLDSYLDDVSITPSETYLDF